MNAGGAPSPSVRRQNTSAAESVYEGVYYGFAMINEVGLRLCVCLCGEVGKDACMLCVCVIVFVDLALVARALANSLLFRPRQ